MAKDEEEPKANMLVDRDIQTVEKESYNKNYGVFYDNMIKKLLKEIDKYSYLTFLNALFVSPIALIVGIWLIEWRIMVISIIWFAWWFSLSIILSEVEKKLKSEAEGNGR